MLHYGMENLTLDIIELVTIYHRPTKTGHARMSNE